MSEFKARCTSITQGLTQQRKRDAEGKQVKNENGHDVWESCPRWNFTFTFAAAPNATYGTINLQTTDPDEAAKYRLNGTYLLALS